MGARPAMRRAVSEVPDDVAAVRALTHALVAADADDDTRAAVVATASALVADLDAAPRRVRVIPRFADMAAGIEPDPSHRTDAMADRAVAGWLSPVGIELDLREDGDDVVADVVFGRAFQGAPGRVHGGMVAAAFDDITGFVLARVRTPAFTGQLTVTYRAPVPVETEVEFRARLREETGRKLFVSAEARLADRVLATADVTFISVGQEHFETHASTLLES